MKPAGRISLRDREQLRQKAIRERNKAIARFANGTKDDADADHQEDFIEDEEEQDET